MKKLLFGFLFLSATAYSQNLVVIKSSPVAINPDSIKNTGSTNAPFMLTEKTKLAGVATGANLGEPVTFIHSKAFATGNGSTDDVTALNTWLNSGANLYLDSGTYKISSQVASTASRGLLNIFCHPGARIVPTNTYAQNGGAFIELRNITFLSVDGMFIDGNGDIASPALTTYDNNMFGIHAEKCANVTVKNCILIDMPKSAIRVDTCSKVRVYSNTATNNYNGAFEIYSSSDVQVLGNVVQGRGSQQGANGTTLGGLVGIFFNNCKRVLASDNQLTNFKNTAIKADGCADVTFTRIQVDTFGKDGIKIQGSTANPTIKRGIISNCIARNKRSWEPDGACYYQVGDCEEFILNGNIASGDAGATGTEYGIFVLSSVTGFVCKKGMISNNTVNNVASTGIYTVKLANTIISSNQINNFCRSGSADYALWINTSGDNLTINGNYFGNDSVPATGSLGVLMQNIKNVSFMNNVVSNVKDQGIRFTVSAGEYININNNTLNNVGDLGIYLSHLNQPTTTVGSVKINNNTFASVNMLGGTQAFAVYTGNIAALTISSLQFSGNTIAKTGTSGTTAPGLFFNDGFGSVTKFDYSSNTYASGIAANPQYNFSPTLITEGSNRFRGSGTPEGVVTSDIGGLYIRSDGSTTTTLYIKTAGSGNTGWTAK